MDKGILARSVAAPDMKVAADLFVSSLNDPILTPFFISIDHSPSEQIDGSEWHTSALIISQNMEHQLIADELGKRVNSKGGVLIQWKKAKSLYKKKFHEEFFHVLKGYPVLAIVVSARENTIISHEQGFANELGISDFYRKVEKNGKVKVELGPFVWDGEEKQETHVVSDRHAPMAFFTASHLLRVHSFIKSAICSRLNVVDFQFCMSVGSDKPPADFSGPYAKMMWLLLGGGNAAGKFTWGGATCTEDFEIDILADNLAGLFREINESPEKYEYQGRDLVPPITGVFLWEKLE